MIGTMNRSDEPAPAGELASQVGSRALVSLEALEQMSLESLLYYVLVGDGRRIGLDKDGASFA